MSDRFTDAGFSTIEDGVAMFRILGVTEQTIKDPMQWQKLKEIGQFTADFEDGAGLLQSIIPRMTPSETPILDRVHNYMRLRKEIVDNNQRGEDLKNHQMSWNRL